MIDEQLFSDLQDLYNTNIQAFKEQNTGYLVEKIYPLTVEDIEKVIDVVAHWPNYATSFDIPKQTIEAIQSTLITKL